VILAAAVFLAIRILTTLIVGVLLVQRHAWLSFGIAQAQLAGLWRLFKPALANTAVPLAQALNLQGMVLVVGAVLGPIAVVTFSTLRTLTRLALQMVLVVSHAAEPELASAYGIRNLPLLRSLFLNSMRGALWLALLAGSMLLVLGSTILAVWTHGKVPFDPELFAWLLLSAVASVLWYGALTVLKAANEHLNAALLYMALSLIAAGLAALLLRYTGEVASAGLPLLLMDVVMTWYTLNAASLLLGMRVTESLREAANPRPLLLLLRNKIAAR
jgi:O-antigen/teichoic acid export membrane protein